MRNYFIRFAKSFFPSFVDGIFFLHPVLSLHFICDYYNAKREKLQYTLRFFVKNANGMLGGEGL